MKKVLTNEEINALKGMNGFHFWTIPKISDELYDKIAVAVRTIGGTWSERHNGFIFAEDPTEKIETLISTGTYEITEEHIWREEVQFYPTPNKIASQMVKLAELVEGDIVLEPSAGRGAILDLFPANVQKIAVEYDEGNAAILEAKGHNVICGDFLAVKDLNVTKVIMNPPFSKYQDVQHVMHAYSMLKPGGILVAIINENTLHRGKTNNSCRRFLEVLKGVKHEIIHLEEGTFSESGTMINTAIIKMWKR